MKHMIVETIFMQFLPPANEVWGKVMFLQASVILLTGGVWSWGYAGPPLSRHPPPPGALLRAVSILL